MMSTPPSIAKWPVPTSALEGPHAAGVLADYLRYFERRGDPRQIDATILRTGSIAGRDLVAILASKGSMAWAEIRTHLLGSSDPSRHAKARAVVAKFEPKAALRLARILAVQSLSPDDRPLALALIELVVAAHGRRILQAQHIRIYCDLAFQLRCFDKVERALAELKIPEPDRLLLETDLMNPFIGSPRGDLKRWKGLLAKAFTPYGIAGLSVAPIGVDGTPFDSLITADLPAVSDGPKVTVVVTSWSPGPEIFTAVKSILSQTWRNLEILVIDDCSPQEFGPTLDLVAALDPRIRVLRQSVNGGTYLARNRGLQEGSGKYFTVHDSDDWAHPERIERQVRALEEDDSLVSVTSMAYRCNSSLVFNLLGTSAMRENASSLMFDLVKVRSRIGYYDRARKGADTEYGLRVQHAFGADTHRILPFPLAMIRLSPGSLSREEFKPGWRHPSRTMYRRSYEVWHNKVKHLPGGLYRPACPERPAFRQPTRFLVDQRGDEALDRQAYDVVLAADLRASASPDPAVVEEALACSRAGMSVGLLHVESYRNASRREVEPLAPVVEAALAGGNIGEILYSDTARVGLLVVRDPTLLQFPPARASGLAVESAIIVARHGARGDDGRLHYEPLDAAKSCFQMFGVEPNWVAVTARARKTLVSEVSGRTVMAKLWPRPLVHDFWRSPRAADPDRKPKVGRIVAERALSNNWTAYPESLQIGPAVEARVLDLARAGRARLLLGRHPPESWRIYSIAQVSVDLFLSQCDYYIHHDQDHASPEESWAIRRAMASGCIVLLPRHWEGTYGPAALYFDGAEAGEMVRTLHGSPDRQQAQRNAAHQWINAPQRLHSFASAVAGYRTAS